MELCLRDWIWPATDSLCQRSISHTGRYSVGISESASLWPMVRVHQGWLLSHDVELEMDNSEGNGT